MCGSARAKVVDPKHRHEDLGESCSRPEVQGFPKAMRSDAQCKILKDDAYGRAVQSRPWWATKRFADPTGRASDLQKCEQIWILGDTGTSQSSLVRPFFFEMCTVMWKLLEHAHTHTYQDLKIMLKSMVRVWSNVGYCLDHRWPVPPNGSKPPTCCLGHQKWKRNTCKNSCSRDAFVF